MNDINNEKNKSAVIIGRVKRTDNLSRIKKEAAEIAFGAASQAPCLGSRLLSCPRMTMLWILRFVCTPLRMTIPTLSFLLSLNLSTAFAEDCTCNLSADNKTLTISNCNDGILRSYSCTNQKTANNIKIGTGVTSIESYAFQYARSLTSITIPKGVTSIDSYAFAGASSLTSITIPDSVESIGEGAFYNATGLTSITIPEGVTSIGESAFHGASSLTSITIPNSVTSIGGGAFDGASSLTSITIPDSVTSIGTEAFSGAKSLTSITIPDSVKSIGDGAFAGASSLESITIPDSVTSIGVAAFIGASSLTSITIPDSVTSIGMAAFINTGLTNIICKGDEESCAATVTAIKAAGYNGNISYQKEDNNGNTGGDVSGDFNPADCYNNGQVPYNNQCVNEYPFAKKRWTPAEANEWLHDGNDNFVVITFKK